MAEELSGELKHEIEKFLDEKQKAREELQHRRTVRWTAILGVTAGGFFAAVAGVISLAFTNIETLATSVARQIAIQTVQSNEVTEALKDHQNKAFDAIAETKVATERVVAEGEELRDRSRDLLNQIKKQAELLEDREQELQDNSELLRTAQSVQEAQSAIVTAALNDEKFRTVIAERVSPAPIGAVLAFELEDCPVGWEAYTPAYGRFIRGVDPSGRVDPEVGRAAGSLQEDTIKRHVHPRPKGVYDAGSTPQFAAWVANDRFYAYGHTNTPDTGPNGDEPETRPKNVALLYCVKTADK